MSALVGKKKKKKTLCPFEATWMDVEIIILSNLDRQSGCVALEWWLYGAGGAVRRYTMSKVRETLARR